MFSGSFANIEVVRLPDEVGSVLRTRVRASPE